MITDEAGRAGASLVIYQEDNGSRSDGCHSLGSFGSLGRCTERSDGEKP